MKTQNESPISEYQRLASRPAMFRRASLVVIATLVGIFVIGYIWSTSTPEFRMKGLPPTLSKDVSMVVDGYSRVEVAPDGSNFTVRAKKATTFADNHQELQGVEVEFPGAEGVDRLLAEKAIFLPGKGAGFKLFLEKDVELVSSSGLSVKSSAMVYDNGTSLGSTEGPIEFTRGELSGSAAGATYDSTSKKIDLLGKVSVEGESSADPESELTKLGVKNLRIVGDRGQISTRNRSVRLSDNVTFESQALMSSPGAVPSKLSARSLEVVLVGDEPRKIIATGGVAATFLPTTARDRKIDVTGDELSGDLTDGSQSISLKGRIRLNVAEKDGSRVEISGSRLDYFFQGGRISGDGAIRLERTASGRVQSASGERIEYSLESGGFSLGGRARFDSAPDFFLADQIKGKLDSKNQLQTLSGEGNASVGRDDLRGFSETRSRRFDATFAAGQVIRLVTAAGPADSSFSSKTDYGNTARVNAPRGMRLEFNLLGQATQLLTQGRTTIKLLGSSESGQAARSLMADDLKVVFEPSDQTIKTAEAKGRAEILLPEEGGIVTKVNSDDFICYFLAGNNRAERCQSSSKGRASRMGSGEVQNLEAGRLAVFFDRNGGNLDFIQAEGRARFSQGDSNGTSEKIIYRLGSGVVSLAGAPVQFWDSRGRSRSKSVEWDTVRKNIALEGDVSTTYYNRAQTGGALPFREGGSAVYVTAARSVVRVAENSVIYQGRARAWQKDNFISADAIEIQIARKSLVARGSVRTLLFDVPRSDAGGSRVTVSGISEVFSYDDSTRLGVYETGVDLRQGQERVQGESVTVKLGTDGQIESFKIEKNVILTQPGRKATGDEAEYVLLDRKVTLKGSPARITEAGRGAAEGGSIVYFLDGRRVVGEGKSANDPKGRVRSVYQVDKQ